MAARRFLADATPAERRTIVGLGAEPAAPPDENDEFPFSVVTRPSVSVTVGLIDNITTRPH